MSPVILLWTLTGNPLIKAEELWWQSLQLWCSNWVEQTSIGSQVMLYCVFLQVYFRDVLLYWLLHCVKYIPTVYSYIYIEIFVLCAYISSFYVRRTFFLIWIVCYIKYIIIIIITLCSWLSCGERILSWNLNLKFAVLIHEHSKNRCIPLSYHILRITDRSTVVEIVLYWFVDPINTQSFRLSVGWITGDILKA